MNLVFFAAFVAACGAAKLDRTYLPPLSSQYAGDAQGSLQTPFITTDNNQGLQPPFGRTSDNNPSQGNQLPSGSYENEHQGVVVEAAAPGTRASNQPSGLGGPRENYGSTDSKVGEAAFRGTKNQAMPNINEAAFQTQAHTPYDNQGIVEINKQNYPDLSAFYQPSGQMNIEYRPGNKLFTDRVSNTIKYHMNIGLNRFNYGFETENGIKMQENGVSSDGVKAQGGYSYTGDDGKVYSVEYTADKDGYRPVGSHLPTPPPIPLEIQESLQQNARDEANGIIDDGSYDAEKYNTEDDYAQSDTNGKYNDRQSNKFEERPASNAGTSAFINQDQQAFVRPNVQGQFLSDDYSKDSSSTQSDVSKFGSSVSGLHNKGQFHSLGEQHGSNPTSAVTNQNQKVFVQQNIPGQFSSYDSFKDSSSAQTTNSKSETSFIGFENSSNKENKVAQDAQSTQFNNRFGDQFSAPPGYFQNANPLLEIDSSKVGFNNNFNNAQPYSEQKYQHNEPIGKPVSSLTKSSSCCTSSGQGSSNIQQIPFSQTSNSFDINNNKNTENDAFSQLGIQSSLMGSDLGFEIGGNAQNSQVAYSDGSFTNSVYLHEVNNNSPQSLGSLPTPILNFGMIPAQNNLNISPQTQESFSQTAVQVSDNRTVANTNPDFINRFSTAFFSQDVLTKQPELTLSTPLDNQPQKSDSGFSEIETSFTDSQPQKPYSLNFGNTQSIQIPSVGQFNTFSGQSLGPDGSYIYSKPSDPFYAPTYTSPDTNKNSGITSSIVNSVTQPLGSLFTNASEGAVFSVQYQGGTGSTQYPQLPAANIAPTLAAKEDQSNGITQASISSFPSITPTSTSQINSEIYEYTKPVQGLPNSYEEEKASESDYIKQQGIVPFSQKEDTITPQVHVDSNSQFGQSFSTSGTSSLGQQATSSRFGTQTSAMFGQKPSQQLFSSQPNFLLEQKITPPHFSTQTNSPFTQKQTVLPFGGQTSTPLNQQTTPTVSGIQTSSSIGQNPSQPQTSFSFGQQSSSRVGDQTISSFGHKPTLSSFGAQTDSPFGEAQTQPQTSFSFGQQTTPSRFGVQTSSIFEQNPTLMQTGGLTSFSFRAPMMPSRIGAQTGPLFGQKQNLPLFGTSLNQQTTATRFGSSFGQQTIPSTLQLFDIQTSAAIDQNHTQPQLGGQTSFSFGQTIPSRIGAPINPSFDQETGSVFEKPNEPNKNTNSDEIDQYNKPTTDFLSNEGNKGPTDFGLQQINSQLGQQSTDSHEKNEVKIEQQITVRPDKQFGNQTLQTGTKPSIQFGVQTESTSADEELSASQEMQDGTQFDLEPMNQSNKQSFSSSVQNDSASKLNQQSQIPIDSQFSEQSNSPFGSLQLTTSQFVKPTGLLEQSFNIKESTTTSEFSSTSTDNTRYQPASLSSQSSFNLQKQGQSQNAQTGEVYQYNKPTQLLLDSTEEVKSRFGENTLQENITEQSGQNKFDTHKPIPSHLSQSKEKFDNVQLSTQDSDVSRNKTESNPQTASLGTLPSSHPFPQFSFYSACCRGAKPQNNQGSQALFGNLGSNSFDFNKNNNQDNKGSGLIENKFGSQGSVVKEPADSNGFGVQKDTHNFIGKGEEFGGPREPPKFDETGYHY